MEMETFEVTWHWAGGRFTIVDRVEALSPNGAVNALMRRLREDYVVTRDSVVVMRTERLEPTRARAS
jgi:hypothetical protein